MKSIGLMIFVLAMAVGTATAQTTSKPQTQPSPVASVAPATERSGMAGDDDVQQLRSDVQQLKVLLNQMRTNLAFVQTTQTPLKHQFEIEADAWQVLIDQMERNVKRIQERGATRGAH